MDGETERKLSALILAEAARLRSQAAEKGVRAYLNPKVRYRPNAKFLSATVRGVQHANRMVDMNEMWKLREEELGQEKDVSRMRQEEDRGPSFSSRHPGSCGSKVRQRDESEDNRKHIRPMKERRLFPQDRPRSRVMKWEVDLEDRETRKRSHYSRRDQEEEHISCRKSVRDHEMDVYTSQPSQQTEVKGKGVKFTGKGVKQELGPSVAAVEPPMLLPEVKKDREEESGGGSMEKPRQEGMDDKEIEEFLKSKCKRGRGAIGSRMDEAGPYLKPTSGVDLLLGRVREEWEDRISHSVIPSWPTSYPEKIYDEPFAPSNEDERKRKSRQQEREKGKEKRHHKHGKRKNKKHDSSGTKKS